MNSFLLGREKFARKPRNPFVGESFFFVRGKKDKKGRPSSPEGAAFVKVEEGGEKILF